jgi:magnesium chelatase family protein
VAVERYTGRVSGPLTDRIDLCARLDTPSFEALGGAAAPRDGPESTAARRAQVTAARAIQLERSGVLNARLGSRELERTAGLSREAQQTLRRAADVRLLTGRGLTKVTKVARTLADLEGRARISSDDVALAVHLRVGEAA